MGQGAEPADAEADFTATDTTKTADRDSALLDAHSTNSGAENAGVPGTQALAVGSRVRRRQPTGGAGVVVEDFDGFHGITVDIGTSRIAGAARRWAVALDSGELVFVDSDELELLPQLAADN